MVLGLWWGEGRCVTGLVWSRFGFKVAVMELLRKRARGVVTLEFLMIFPMIVGLVYGAAGYGVLFFNKYRMQLVVDKAAASVLALDRRQFDAFDEEAETYSNGVLDALIGQLPADTSGRISSKSCITSSDGGIDLLVCALVADGSETPFLPQLNFGFLGTFPPLPDSLKVSSAVAF